MKVEIISVSTRLLSSQLPDVDAIHATGCVIAMQLDVTCRVSVAEEAPMIANMIRVALSRSDVVVVIGALNTDNNPILKALQRVTNREQLPNFPKLVDATVLGSPTDENDPYGLLLQEENGILVCLPNNRLALDGMLEAEVFPYLEKQAQRTRHARWRLIRSVGLQLSSVEAKLNDLRLELRQTINISAHAGRVDVRARVEADTESQADRELGYLVTDIERRLGDIIYGYGDDSLEAVTLDAINARQKKVFLFASPIEAAKRLREHWASSELVEFCNEVQTAKIEQRIQSLEETGAIDHMGACRQIAEQLRLAKGADYCLVLCRHNRPGSVQLTSTLATKASVAKMERAFSGHPENINEWAATLGILQLRSALMLDAMGES